MSYTINILAKLSDVTPRTLRFYDQIGLLKPAYIAENGYRLYEEKELLRLQQILFFKELGFELKDIQEALTQKGFDQRVALKEHKTALLANMKRQRALVQTIDKTLNHLDGQTPISREDIFKGFTHSKAQEELQTKLVDSWTKYFGEEKGRQQLKDALEMTRHWTLEELNNYYGRVQKIVDSAFEMLSQAIPAEAHEAQALMQTHCALLREAQVVDKTFYINLSNYMCDPTQKAVLDTTHPGTAEYMAKAMQIFAEANL